MKISFVILGSVMAFTASFMAHAGDLGLVCYTDGDTGSYVGDSPNQFISNRAGLTFKWSKDTFVILVDRKDFLRGYEYTIIKIDNVDGGYSTNRISVKNYDDEIDINDEVQCRVDD